MEHLLPRGQVLPRAKKRLLRVFLGIGGIRPLLHTVLRDGTGVFLVRTGEAFPKIQRCIHVKISSH